MADKVTGTSTTAGERDVVYTSLREGVNNTSGSVIEVMEIGAKKRNSGGEINKSLSTLAERLYSVELALGWNGDVKTNTTPTTPTTFKHELNSTEALPNGFKDSASVDTGYRPVSGESIAVKVDKLTQQVAYTNYVMNRQGGMKWQSAGEYVSNSDLSADQTITMNASYQYTVGEGELMVFISGKNRVVGVEYLEVGTAGTLSNTIILKANNFPPDKFLDIYCFTTGGNYAVGHSHTGYASTASLNALTSTVEALTTSTSTGSGANTTAIGLLDTAVGSNSTDISNIETDLTTNYVTNNSLTSTLSSYATTASIGSFVTSTQLDTRVPTTGSTGDVLTKTATGYAFSTPTIVPSGTDGQILKYNSSNNLATGTVHDLLPSTWTSGDYLTKNTIGELVWSAPTVNTGVSAVNKKVLTVANQGTMETGHTGEGYATSNETSYDFNTDTTYATLVATTTSILFAGTSTQEYATWSMRLELKDLDTSSPSIEIQGTFANWEFSGNTTLTSSYQGKTTVSLGITGTWISDIDLEFRWDNANKRLYTKLSNTRAELAIDYRGTVMEYQEVTIQDSDASIGSITGTGTIGQYLVRTGNGLTDFGWSTLGGNGSVAPVLTGTELNGDPYTDSATGDTYTYSTSSASWVLDDTSATTAGAKTGTTGQHLVRTGTGASDFNWADSVQSSAPQVGPIMLDSNSSTTFVKSFVMDVSNITTATVDVLVHVYNNNSTVNTENENVGRLYLVYRKTSNKLEASIGYVHGDASSNRKDTRILGAATWPTSKTSLSSFISSNSSSVRTEGTSTVLEDNVHVSMNSTFTSITVYFESTSTLRLAGTGVFTKWN